MNFKVFNLLLLILLTSCARSQTNYAISDHYDGKTFNNTPKTSDKNLFDLLKWRFSTTAKDWPENVKNSKFDLPKVNGSEIIVTWINHATFLIQTPEINILTDPVYAERVSPFSFIGPKRVRKPGVKFDDLPKIDVVIISHNHYDHLDLETLKKIADKYSPTILIPLGDKELLESNGIKMSVEMDWSDEVEIEKNIFTFLPAKHWSARWITDKRESLWGSFMIKSNVKHIYFGGDTGYGNHFKDIASKYSKIDLALLPIGAYEPRWFMSEHHMNPDESVNAHIDLKSHQTIGMHFGTFQLTNEGIDEPVDDLIKAKAKYKINEESFRVLGVGESLILK